MKYYNSVLLNERENDMRTKTIYYLAFLLLMVSAFSFSGCSKLSGPSDAEAIKAISENEFFAHEVTLQPPVVVMDKGSRTKNGDWPVTVKVKFTFATKDGVSAPVEKTLVFNLRKAKDSAGKDTWKAALNP
jgi:hypothetical protein